MFTPAEKKLLLGLLDSQLVLIESTLRLAAQTSASFQNALADYPHIIRLKDKIEKEPPLATIKSVKPDDEHPF